MAIRKAVILAAGYGTRFLPVTKATPKEMLPIVDKPVIQYVVEDIVAAGVKDIILVTSAQKRLLEDHFDHSFELETVLRNSDKKELLEEILAIANLANFISIRQKGARGTLPAVACGYQAIGDEPFLALWGDDFFVSSPSRCQQLVQVYEKYKAPVLALFETNDPEDTYRYSFLEGKEVEPGVMRVEKMVEKPGPGVVRSNLASSGSIVTPEIMECGARIQPNAAGEYVLADAYAQLIKEGKPVYAVTIAHSSYYDCGNKLDYIKTNIELALQHPEMGEELYQYLQELLGKEKTALLLNRSHQAVVR